MPFRKIVFPVDYSEPCAAIVPYVKEMQRHFSTGLAVVHAYGPEALAYSPLPITDPDLPQEVKARAAERLRDFVERHFPGQSEIEMFSGLGETGSVIHDFVRREGADVVMLPTHGHGPLRRLLLGSVTAKILHDMTVPVWTVAHSSGAAKIPCRSVLAAVDTNEEGETVIRAAVSLAASYGARLSLAYVLEMPPANVETGFATYQDDFVAAATARMERIKAKVGINAPVAILTGPVAEAVGEEAQRVQADLIVTGRGQASGAFSRMWSHLYPIVRHAPCPVLSI